MKKTKIWYWVLTVLFAAAMLFSAVPDILVNKQATDIMEKQLHYPTYLIAFVGWAKTLGVLAILVPGFPRIKEWAYAGLFIDLTGAAYSMLASGVPVLYVLPMLPFFLLGIGSYYFYHKKLKLEGQPAWIASGKRVETGARITAEV